MTRAQTEKPLAIHADAATPFLRWAGSKRKMLGYLRPCWRPHHSRYVEPFVGSAALYFSLRPSVALLSDVNVDLIEAFRAVRDFPEEVYERVTKLPRGRDAYYRMRSRSASELNSLDRAVRFIYLNRFCFNGLYRTNTAGEFNVPYAGKKTPSLPAVGVFREAAAALQSAAIMHGDFEEVLRRNVRGGDFIYLDPPFAVANRRIFRQYGPQTFGLEDLQRLSALLPWIVNKGASFVLSYAMSPEALKYFADWPCRRAITQRNVGGFADRRRRAVEMIIASDAQILSV